ncbi:hypothetical protein BPT24_108 [Tenacibaculum phage pT24]|uniref:Uncharacterized protein n=1 Tax=Tenacibaculum phage pT24 TaxID=1880590 RepID=A0A1B4XWP0_9CAUD|nr:hypothetical protein HYP10_gp108 [Tenacibaculum phage pT24]BAV39233.1 hypothetical protein BPT24_108 [Tenacibaculum phage pT24]
MRHKQLVDDGIDLSHITETFDKSTHIEISNTVGDFSDKSDTSFLFEYLQQNDYRYSPYIETLRSEQIRIKNPLVANQIFGDLYGAFSNRIDSVEIFDVIITYFGFGEQYYFEKLISQYRNILVNDLSRRMDIDLNSMDK